ncbi:MAG: hypothetical protein IPK16_29220 [Anaerolineales bacterium]|nr:hypothetical protein [Anaerolineales bacterium]
MQYTSAALSFLIRDLFGAGWAPRKNPSAPDYLPAKLVMSEGAANRSPRARQVVMEITRLGYNQFIHWLRRSSVFIETTFQNGDLRRYLLYILLANLAAMSLFALMAGN